MKTLIEAVRFWFAITPRWRLWPSRAYLQWRLGTVYGSFNYRNHAEFQLLWHRPDGAQLRSVRKLIGAAWKDHDNVINFLTWREKMVVK